MSLFLSSKLGFDEALGPGKDAGRETTIFEALEAAKAQTSEWGSSSMDFLRTQRKIMGNSWENHRKFMGNVFTLQKFMGNS